ncbi:TolB domain-containing protein [Psychrobacillus sp. NPDC096426]|uniref:TolB family protein n=1 Tax=Psychrobacillus sp. NPDC096426 TaxID=3364491 RepID=UPI0037FE25DA
MSKLLYLLIIFCLIFPAAIYAETNTLGVKVAFVRDGYVWIKDNGIEEKITDKQAVYNYPPSWSFDGTLILYQKNVRGNINKSIETSNELWVYDVSTRKHHKIFYDGYNPKWSPTENIVAFTDRGVLNISNLETFTNIALGVDSYEWHPNGKGFIASSSASLRPDGWTNPVLFTITLTDDYFKNWDLTKHVKKLFVIPKEIGINDKRIMSINAGSFSFSPNGQWISFIVNPTGSLSMDSDMLCIISEGGDDFEVIDEVILDFKPKWAITKNTLGYIAGGGRIVFGFKNKDLKVTELPAAPSLNLTPNNFAEMGFTWVNDMSLIVSRVQESEWSNDPTKRPKPSLYYVAINGQKQLKITTPKKEFGDYNPLFLKSINKITWIRKSDIIATKKDLWIADPNGNNAEVWIHDIEGYGFFPF